MKRKGKALGLHEIDPDALPSSMVQKYLILDCIHFRTVHSNFSQVPCFEAESQLERFVSGLPLENA